MVKPLVETTLLEAIKSAEQEFTPEAIEQEFTPVIEAFGKEFAQDPNRHLPDAIRRFVVVRTSSVLKEKLIRMLTHPNHVKRYTEDSRIFVRDMMIMLMMGGSPIPSEKIEQEFTPVIEAFEKEFAQDPNRHLWYALCLYAAVRESPDLKVRLLKLIRKHAEKYTDENRCLALETLQAWLDGSSEASTEQG